jgi:DNA-binding MarR family transcriptional regulator
MTEKGRNLMTELKHALAEIEVAMLEGFNDSEVDRLKADIHKILDNIENYQSSIE